MIRELPHTVATDTGHLVAGSLIRSASTGRDLGYVWPTQGSRAGWCWRTADGQNSGDRQSKAAAIQVLTDAEHMRAPRQPQLWSEAEAMAAPLQGVRAVNGVTITTCASPVRVTRRDPAPAPKPERQIAWDNQPELDSASLSAAIASALDRHTR